MPWYKTGTIAVSGTTVTGTGTNWTDAKQGIGPGQALLVPAAGTVKMYEIKSVDSATKLTLVSSAGTIAAGQAYAIMSFYADSIPDFARRLSAQLSYYQSQMDGWQNIMTGSGTITMTAPDGTTVNISSFAKLTADMNTLSAVANAALPLKGLPPSSITDINNMGPTSDYIGIWNFSGSAQYNLSNLPEATSGKLEIYPAGAFNGSQEYTTRYGSKYIRSLAAAWNVSSPSWSPWYLVGFAYRNQSSVDLNTLTNANFVGGSLTNGPSTMGNATCFVSSIARYDGALIYQELQYTTSGRKFVRSCVSGTWTDWAEIYTTNSKPALTDLSGSLPVSSLSGILPVSKGGTGVTSLSSLLSALGFANTANSFTVPCNGRDLRLVAASEVVTTNASGEGTISFKQAFPNQCLAVMLTLGDRTGTSIVIINYSPTRTTSFDYHAYTGTSNFASSPCRINYIAIGY